MTSRPLADKIRDSCPDRLGGEAAMAVAACARGPSDALELLEALGLLGADWRWDVARVAGQAVTAARLGQGISANAMRHRVPRRAWPLICTAFRELAAAGLAARAGRTVSLSPGAKGRSVATWRLTRAGEDLAADIAPAPGLARFMLRLT